MILQTTLIYQSSFRPDIKVDVSYASIILQALKAHLLLIQFRKILEEQRNGFDAFHEIEYAEMLIEQIA